MAFCNKCYDAIIFVHDFTYKTLSHDWNYIVDAVMRPKFGKSRISMREVIITFILPGIDQKNQFFKRCSLFKFNNLGLALCITLKVYVSVAKELKVKFRRFWGLIPTFA